MRIIGGKFRNHKLSSPKGAQTRPTLNKLRETFFNICRPYIENTCFLDLFSGSGAIGLEAISHGASHSTFIDNSFNAVQTIHKNISLLSIEEQTTVLKGNVFSCLQHLIKKKELFDIVFADPPYENFSKTPFTNSFFYTTIRMVSGKYLLKPKNYFFIETKNTSFPDFKLPKSLKKISVRKIGDSLLWQFEKIIAEDSDESSLPGKL